MNLENKLTAVMFTYQAADWIQQTIASFFNVVDEIIVVDAGRPGNSDDGTFEKLREFSEVCEVFEIEHDGFNWPKEVLETKAKLIVIKAKWWDCPPGHDHQHVFTEAGRKGKQNKYTDWEATDIVRNGNMAMDLASDRGAKWIFRTDDDWVFYPNILHIKEIIDGFCAVPTANAINIHLVGCAGDIYHIDCTGEIVDIDDRLKDYQFCLPGLFRLSEGFMFCSVAVFPYNRHSSLNYGTYVDRRVSAMHTKYAFPDKYKNNREKLLNLFKRHYRTAFSLWKDPVVANYRDVNSIEELKEIIWAEVEQKYSELKKSVENGFTLKKADRRLTLPYPPQVLEMNPFEYIKKGYPCGLPIEYVDNAIENSYWEPH
jgi:hypothetical protein